MAILSWFKSMGNSVKEKPTSSTVTSDTDIQFDTDTDFETEKITVSSTFKQLQQQQTYNNDNSNNKIDEQEVPLEEEGEKQQYSNYDIEMVCSIDTTGRMFDYFEEIKKSIPNTLSVLFQKIPRLKISFICHGDYCDDVLSRKQQQSSNNNQKNISNGTISVLPFTNNIDSIIEWLDGIGKTDGADAPEAYEYVLHKVRELPWSYQSKKILLMFGDDVPHPPSFTDQHYYWRNELDYIRKIGIKIYGIQCFNNKHAQLFYEEMASLSFGGRYIHLLDKYNAKHMMVLAALRETEEKGTPLLEAYLDTQFDKNDLLNRFENIWSPVYVRERDPSNVRFAWWDISNDIDPNPRYLWNDQHRHFELNETYNFIIPPPSISSNHQQQQLQNVNNSNSKQLIPSTPLNSYHLVNNQNNSMIGNQQQHQSPQSQQQYNNLLSYIPYTPLKSTTTTTTTTYMSPMNGGKDRSSATTTTTVHQYENEAGYQSFSPPHAPNIFANSNNNHLFISPNPKSPQSPFNLTTQMPTAARLNFTNQQAKLGVVLSSSKKRKSSEDLLESSSSTNSNIVNNGNGNNNGTKIHESEDEVEPLTNTNLYKQLKEKEIQSQLHNQHPQHYNYRLSNTPGKMVTSSIQHSPYHPYISTFNNQKQQQQQQQIELKLKSTISPASSSSTSPTVSPRELLFESNQQNQQLLQTKKQTNNNQNHNFVNNLIWLEIPKPPHSTTSSTSTSLASSESGDQELEIDLVQIGLNIRNNSSQSSQSSQSTTTTTTSTTQQQQFVYNHNNENLNGNHNNKQLTNNIYKEGDFVTIKSNEYDFMIGKVLSVSKTHTQQQKQFITIQKFQCIVKDNDRFYQLTNRKHQYTLDRLLGTVDLKFDETSGFYHIILPQINVIPPLQQQYQSSSPLGSYQNLQKQTKPYPNIIELN